MSDTDAAPDQPPVAEGDPAPALPGQVASEADVGPAEGDPSTEDEALEIEHEGETYRVPKALKDAFLRHADYTRKTQELAEHRRAFEREAVEQRQAIQQDLETHARMAALDDQIGAYERLDWGTLEREDPVRAQSLWRQYSQLKEGRAELLGHIELARQVSALETQRETARRAEEGHQTLAREVPGWSPDLSSKLGAFAQTEFGFTPEEIGTVSDPRMVRVLFLAQLGRQSQLQDAAAKTASASQSAAPIGKLGSNAPAGRSPDRMSTDEWMSFERERLRRKTR